MSPNPLFNYDAQAHYQQFSQEFRLNGKYADLRWIGGVYYLKYKTTNFEQTTLPDFIPPLPVPYGDRLANLNLPTRPPSAFGQLEERFTGHLVGIGGWGHTLHHEGYV